MMIFTNVGRIISWAATAMGILQITMGFYLASTLDDPTQIQRYSTAEDTGEMIDKGIYYLLVGIAFGVITEISRSVTNRK